MRKSVGPLKGSTSQDPQSRSVHSSGQVASKLCETCGNAWAKLLQEGLIHLEDFYFFMDCTGHEIIISSGPHPAPRIQEIALFSTQNNHWTQALARRPSGARTHAACKAITPHARAQKEAGRSGRSRPRILHWACVQIQNDTNPCEDFQETFSSKFTVRLLHIFPSEDACFGFRHLFVT